MITDHLFYPFYSWLACRRRNLVITCNQVTVSRVSYQVDNISHQFFFLYFYPL
ncbi:MAG: hypothetical protein UW45_C0047G0004 [Parcubacteria group bacterium GW2011_GWC2_44_22]|nr:MAG: hypothetical protein UW45_C0047G0004 [Parcubacteria group bacterium GW2011_GWC2_44_22]